MSDVIIKTVLKNIGEHIGGNLGGGVATVAYGTALTEAEVINSAIRYQEGRLTFSDIFSATVAFETVLLGFGIAAAAPGIGIAAVVVGAAAAAAFVMRDGVAIEAAWSAFTDAHSRGEQPWDFLPTVYEAYTAAAYKRVTSRTNTDFRSALEWQPPRDPLAIDLDSDGIETVGIPTNGTPILFDHNADGSRTGTGWLKPDDAWLVLDRDANGLIDSGRELFGVDTQITVTETVNGSTVTHTRNARSGFEALRTLDANADGKFDSADAAFTQVRLWQDLDQDGVSDAGELYTLADKGITRISLAETASTTNLGNGNAVTATASVTRANGSTTHIDSVDLSAGNLDLADNPFYREFSDSIALTDSARNLPEMHGSGWVRDLREAMSLGTSQASALAAELAAYAGLATREQQRSALDDVVERWARSTGRVDTDALRAVSGTVTAETSTTRTIQYTTADPGSYDPSAGIVRAIELRLPSDAYYEWSYGGPSPVKVLNAAGHEVLRRLGVLEAFNGMRFINFTETQAVSAGTGQSTGGGSGSGGVAQTTGLRTDWSMTLAAQQIAFIDSAYEALQDSVYSALVVQTRLRPYLDAIELVIDESGIRFDTQAVVAAVHFLPANDRRWRKAA